MQRWPTIGRTSLDGADIELTAEGALIGPFFLPFVALLRPCPAILRPLA